MFLFAMVFMDTAATIPTGAMAERWKFSAFVVYGLFMSMFLYPLYGNWVWGGGWLSQLGRELRPRPRPRRLRRLVGRAHDGRRGRAGRRRSCSARASASSAATARSAPIPGHNMPMAIVGTFILAFGWFGFNAGSTLAGADPRIGIIAVNTMIASAAGALSAPALPVAPLRQARRRHGLQRHARRPGRHHRAVRVRHARRPRCSSALIAGVLVVVERPRSIERTFRIDDPGRRDRGARRHAASGARSRSGSSPTAATATAGTASRARCAACSSATPASSSRSSSAWLTNVLFVFLAAFVFFRLIDRLIGNRVNAETEFSGLDSTEMGSEAYPPGMAKRKSPSPRENPRGGANNSRRSYEAGEVIGFSAKTDFDFALLVRRK